MPARSVLHVNLRIGHDLFQHADVLGEPSPTAGRQAIHGLWSWSCRALPDVYQTRLTQNVQVPAEISVGERAHCFQIVEKQPLGIGRQRGQNAQARLFVHNTVEAGDSDRVRPRKKGSGVSGGKPPRVGLEPTTPESQVVDAQGLTNSTSIDGTKYDTKSNAETNTSTALDLIIDAWPTLPEAIRAGIAAMVKAATDRESAE